MNTSTLPAGYNVLDFEVPRFEAQDALNDGVVALIGAGELDRALAAVKAVAAAQIGHLPQYAGMHDGPGWTLVRFTRPVVTKGGCRFAEGDYAVADLTPPVLPFAAVGVPTVRAYSTRGAVHVEVARGYFEVVG